MEKEILIRISYFDSEYSATQKGHEIRERGCRSRTAEDGKRDATDGLWANYIIQHEAIRNTPSQTTRQCTVIFDLMDRYILLQNFAQNAN